MSAISIQNLPAEIRLMIWDAVGREEDFQSLLQTSRQIRFDILATIPGGGLSCACRLPTPCQCGLAIKIERLTVILEPTCSQRSWLTFRVSRRASSQGTVWTVRNLSSPLALALRYLRPRQILIDLCAPKRGHYLVAYWTLRAKLSDTCLALCLVQTQPVPSLRVHFSDSWTDGERRPNKPFWENRPFLRTADKMTLRWYPVKKRDLETRHRFHYFYETLMMTFSVNQTWRYAQVTFDRVPPSTRCTFKLESVSVVNGEKSVEYYGHEAFRLTAWARYEHLFRAGIIRPPQVMPDPKRYTALKADWNRQGPRHQAFETAFTRFMMLARHTREPYAPGQAHYSTAQTRDLWMQMVHCFSYAGKNAGNQGKEVPWTWSIAMPRPLFLRWLCVYLGDRQMKDNWATMM